MAEPAPLPIKDYRALARKIAVAIISMASLPYVLLYMVFYSSYNDSIRGQVIGALINVVESHKRTIDDFLAERLADLRSVSSLLSLAALSDPGQLARTLGSLRQVNEAFVDLGLIAQNGRHVAYAGPYGLGQADYSGSPWFNRVMASGSHVSDVFLGVRHVPHFIVAVKVVYQGRDYILRATIDTARFTSLVEAVRLGSTGEAFLVNREGLYQTQPRTGGQLLSPSDLPMPEFFEGVRVLEEVQRRERTVVLAKTWLKGGEWLLVCQQDTADAFASLRDVRRNAVLVGVAGGLVVIAVTAFFIVRLMRRKASSDLEKDMLNERIIESGKLASLGELAEGVAHEINNPLAIMLEEAGWVEDLMEEDRDILERSHHRQEYERSLQQIRSQGRRCKEITTKLLGFARRAQGPEGPTDLNELLGEVAQVMAKPAAYAQVSLRLDLEPDLPPVAGSPSELQQVVMNLMNNALDAMEHTGGELSLATRRGGKRQVALTVHNNGPEIPPELLPRLFVPFFTTKPKGKGTGLGLAICQGIITKMGGAITVQSSPGQGVTFTVTLPVYDGPPPGGAGRTAKA